MLKFILLLSLVVSCASFEKETLKEQNDKATEYNNSSDRVR